MEVHLSAVSLLSTHHVRKHYFDFMCEIESAPVLSILSAYDQLAKLTFLS